MLGHRHHVDGFVAQHSAQLRIWNDGLLVRRILQIVGLDVLPDFSHHLRAKQGIRADDFGELLGRSDGGVETALIFGGGRFWVHEQVELAFTLSNRE